jgi:hypothetical protein
LSLGTVRGLMDEVDTLPSAPGLGGTGGTLYPSSDLLGGVGCACKDLRYSSGGGGTGGGAGAREAAWACCLDTTGGSFAKTPLRTVRKSEMEDFCSINQFRKPKLRYSNPHTSQYSAHCAKYGWYMRPSPPTCCPGRTNMSCEGVTYAIGLSRG